MKNTLALITLSLLMFSCGSERKASIKGTFSGLNGDTVLLEMVTTKERRIVDSTQTNRQGGYKFRVKLPESAPVFFNILCDGSSIPLIVAPGEKVIVNSLCDLSCNYTVEGSDDSQLLKTFNAFYRKGALTLDSLSHLYVETPLIATNETLRKELLDQYLKEYYRIKREQIGFIISHPASTAALYALYQRLPNDTWLFNEKDDLTYSQIVADSIAARFPESQRVKVLQREIEERKKALELVNQVALQQQDGLKFPEIDLQDTYGKSQKLSALNGKTILLDFWSMKDQGYPLHNAELKELYKTYADRGLVVYQVSLGDEKGPWIETVQQQKLPWISVFDPRGSAGVAAMSYNIQAVPSNVLIDREGVVRGRNIFGEKLKSKIEELIP